MVTAPEPGTMPGAKARMSPAIAWAAAPAGA